MSKKGVAWYFRGYSCCSKKSCFGFKCAPDAYKLPNWKLVVEPSLNVSVASTTFYWVIIGPVVPSYLSIMCVLRENSPKKSLWEPPAQLQLLQHTTPPTEIHNGVPLGIHGGRDFDLTLTGRAPGKVLQLHRSLGNFNSLILSGTNGEFWSTFRL